MWSHATLTVYKSVIMAAAEPLNCAMLGGRGCTQCHEASSLANLWQSRIDRGPHGLGHTFATWPENAGTPSRGSMSSWARLVGAGVAMAAAGWVGFAGDDSGRAGSGHLSTD
jgi:hypothetical protein